MGFVGILPCCYWVGSLDWKTFWIPLIFAFNPQKVKLAGGSTAPKAWVMFKEEMGNPLFLKLALEDGWLSPLNWVRLF